MFTVSVSRHKDLIMDIANATCKGGVSYVRGREDRESNLLKDQITGATAEVAYSLFFFGSVEPVLQKRWAYNTYSPEHRGDKGFDFPQLLADVKGSSLLPGRNPLDYNLIVPRTERKTGWNYYQALVLPEEKVLLTGWCADDELNDFESGRWPGSFAVPTQRLRKLHWMRWQHIEVEEYHEKPY